jgi:hypothetical protein
MWRDDPATYAGYIDACLLHIRHGDAYQLCLTTGIDIYGDVDVVDAVDLEAQALGLQAELLQTRSGISDGGEYNPFAQTRERDSGAVVATSEDKKSVRCQSVAHPLVLFR